MDKEHNVYVGYDRREDIAYRVCEYSIYRNSGNAKVIPLKQKELRNRDLYTREVDPLSSTEFTFTRFLVPALENYEGWALFCDCDFVWDGDISEVFALADPQYAVMVVQHDYRPSNETKMDGCKQTQYPRKNWSSMILWNCEHPSNQQLTPELVNSESGEFLHRFQWLEDDEIGSIDPVYNFLVGYNQEKKTGQPVAYHWTEGGPWFENYRDCEYNLKWWEYLLEYSEVISKSFDPTSVPITWVTSLNRDYWNKAAQYTLPTWRNLPGEVIFVWDDKPASIGFGKNVQFWKEVVSTDDPWIKESMGGAKADRFWKKSRAQIWAARKYRGNLVIWIDADIEVTRPLSLIQAIKLLQPEDQVWATLDPGRDWEEQWDVIDTGIVAFNTRHRDFEQFIREYSLTWYNGGIYEYPQPYDHHVVARLSDERWPIMTLCNHWSTWEDEPVHPINRVAMKNSILDPWMIHHLGIGNKKSLKDNESEE